MGHPDTLTQQDTIDPRNADTQEFPERPFDEQIDQADGSAIPPQPVRGSSDGTGQAPARELDDEPSTGQLNDEEKSWHPPDGPPGSVDEPVDPEAEHRTRDGIF
ncbi:MAG TPA: hypothetical protein PKA82_14395 [Pyrinomonadaceae bacterium]|nr:hypothetical protein [Pyrinomonadaceae bacterium]